MGFAVLMPADHPLADRDTLAFADTLGSDYVGLHAASSINMRTHAAARKAGKVLRLRNCGSELARDDQLTSAEFLLTSPQLAVTNPLAGDSLN
jgi:hypothetical protein